MLGKEALDMNRTWNIITAAIACLLTSCSGHLGPDSESGQAISFSVSQSFSAEVTKASLFEPEDLYMDADSHEGNFRVMAYNSDTDECHFDNPEWVRFIYYPTSPSCQDGISGTVPASIPDTGPFHMHWTFSHICRTIRQAQT